MNLNPNGKLYDGEPSDTEIRLTDEEYVELLQLPPSGRNAALVKMRMTAAEKRGLASLTVTQGAVVDPGAHPDLTPAAASLRSFLAELNHYLLNLEAAIRGTELDRQAVTLRQYAERAIAFHDTPYEEFVPKATAPETKFDSEYFNDQTE